MSTCRSVRYFVVAAAVLFAAGSAVVHAETNLNFVLGKKYLDSDDWPVGDNQGSLSFLSTFGPRSWPIQIAIDLMVSGFTESSFEIDRPGVEITGDDVVQATYELGVGVRKIWRTGRARPFVGGGLAIIWARQGRVEFLLPPPEGDHPDVITRPPMIISEEDEAPGAWVDGGIFWRLGKRFNIGLEARYSRAELSFTGREVQAGGFNLGLILGWGWGGGARIVK